MAKLVEMDDNVKFSSQLEEDVGPIVFVNKFAVKPEFFWRRFQNFYKLKAFSFGIFIIKI